MPLRVHCPNNCLIRMPTNRAGRIVRCPKCKSPIKIPEIPESELASGKPIPCHAKAVRPRESDPIDNANEIVSDEAADDLEIIGQSQTDASPTNSSPDGSAQQPRLPLPEVLKPVARLSPVVVTHPKNPESETGDSQAADELVPEDPAEQFVGKPVESTTVSSTTVSSRESSGDSTGAAAQTGTNEDEVIETVTGPIIDSQSNSESPDDWIDGDGIPIIVRDAKHPPTHSSKRAKSKSARASKKRNKVKTVGVDRVAVESTVDDETAVATTSTDPRRRSSVEGGIASQSESGKSAALNLVMRDPNRSADALVTATKAEQRTLPRKRVIDRVEPPKPGPRVSRPEAGSDVPSFESKLDFLPSAAQLLIDFGVGTGEFSGVRSEKDWKDRLEKANSDRKVLARFFALCLCIVSIVNMVPAIYHWYQWTQMVETMPLPRWIYLLIFVGAIHFVYAIFLAQIPDWSAMRAVSVAMLAIAFVFGFVSTGLLIGGGQGNLIDFLGIPFILNRQACIWCVAMLCLATLMSYWGGRESSNWQRAEHLLREILTTSNGQA
jgi:hypothetical protein